MKRGWCNVHYLRWYKYGDPMTVKSTQRHGMSEPDRFWSYVDKSDDCWLWTGARTTAGYGHLSLYRLGLKSIYAHRYSLELHQGRPVSADLKVCHRCDNPPCVNPAHLFTGTQSDNIRDMVSKGRKGRGPQGAELAAAKLTDDIVRQARIRYANGETATALGKEYGVTQATMSKVVTRKSWRHVA